VGESPKPPFQLSFNASLKIDFQGSRVTSDGGLILVRELDERLGFGELIQQHLTDSRRCKNTQFPFADLLRQSATPQALVAEVRSLGRWPIPLAGAATRTSVGEIGQTRGSSEL
jgi:hypothetical protein